MGLDNLQNGLTNLSTTSKAILGGVAAASVVGAGLGAAALIKKKRKKNKKRTSRYKRHRVHSKKKKRKKHYPRTAGKRKDRSHKRIRFTKNGQPYIITGSGKAKFIKKSSARRSRKMKGGRY